MAQNIGKSVCGIRYVTYRMSQFRLISNNVCRYLKKISSFKCNKKIHDKDTADFYLIAVNDVTKIFQENLGLGQLNDYEQELVVSAAEQLDGEIKKGIEFAANYSQ